MRKFIDPYNYTKKDETFLNHDDNLVDISGYLPLKDELQLIRQQSVVSYEILKAKRDAYYDTQNSLRRELSDFENNPEVFEQLSKLKNPDIIDLSEHYNNAYNMYKNIYSDNNISDDNISTDNVENIDSDKTTPAE
uniref:Uncharacterized protein n=1 Tax=Dulem virus 204 TaxID=3145681 RepID=A0AAU8AU13_9VIRU